MSPGMSNIVRLAALTGQRRAEVAGLRQADIEWSLEAPCLTIARGRAKKSQSAPGAAVPAGLRSLLRGACSRIEPRVSVSRTRWQEHPPT